MVPVFTKSCFKIPKIIKLIVFSNLLTIELWEIWSADLWCVIWVRLGLHLQKRNFCTLSYEKKSYVVWSHINIMVLTMFQRKWRFFPMLAKDLKNFLHRCKVLFLIYICDIIFMKIEVYKRRNCSVNMAKKCYFPNFNI